MSESPWRLLEVTLSFLSYNRDCIFLTASFTVDMVSFVKPGTTFLSLWTDWFRCCLPSPSGAATQNTERWLEFYCPWFIDLQLPLVSLASLCLATGLWQALYCQQIAFSFSYWKEELKHKRQPIKQLTFYWSFPSEFYTLNTRGFLRPEDFCTIPGWNWVNHYHNTWVPVERSRMSTAGEVPGYKSTLLSPPRCYF